MQKKVILLVLISYLIKNQLADGSSNENDFIQKFLSVFKPSLGLVGIGVIGIVSYGLLDQYYRDNIMPKEERLTELKKLLTHPNWQDHNGQEILKKRIKKVEKIIQEQNQKKESQMKALEENTNKNESKSELSKKLNPEKTKNEGNFFLVENKNHQRKSYNLLLLLPGQPQTIFQPHIYEPINLNTFLKSYLPAASLKKPYDHEKNIDSQYNTFKPY